MSARIAVLGSGIQGSTLALELAERGLAVDLYERDAKPLGRASERNEGKIHLGLIYAKDPSLATAQAMLEGALSFGPLLSRWTRNEFDRVPRARAFDYLVPCDSMCSPDELIDYYERLQMIYEQLIKEEGRDYLGTTPERLFQPVNARHYERFACAEHVQAAFSTAELSIDAPALCEVLRPHLRASDQIRLHLGCRVESIERRAGGLRVEGRRSLGDGATEPFRGEYDHVVNATWEHRLPLDAQLGLAPHRPWVYRLKYRVLAELPESLRGMPSLTLVLGAYGDIVNYRDRPAYLSWYPECLRGWSIELAPPKDWDRLTRGDLESEAAQAIGAKTLRALDRFVPGLGESTMVAVGAGVIFAWGDRDIDHSESELHQRDAIGVLSCDGYHTIDTGKITTAPLFAMQAADRICGAAKQGS